MSIDSADGSGLREYFGYEEIGDSPAEQKLQELRARLENLRLRSERVLPAEAERKAAEMAARADAAQIHRLDSTASRSIMSRMIFAAAFFVLLSLPMPPATAQQQVPGGGTVTVAVGAPTPVYGMRSQDCDAAPSFEAVRDRLPASSLGVFVDGGTGVRRSRSCGGPTPVRAIAIIAGQPGTETLELFGDTVEIIAR